MILVNRTKFKLPTQRKLKYEQIRDKAQLQVRRHIHIGAAAVPGSPGPLNPEEWMRLREYDGGDHISTAPKWNGQHFPFAPWGEHGCALELPQDVGAFLMTSYNKGAPMVCESEGDLIIDILRPGEELPKGVAVVRLDIDDPLNWSSEGYYQGGVDSPVSFSRGKMEPPKPYNAKDASVPAKVINDMKAAHSAG